jgi:ComF family protein
MPVGPALVDLLGGILVPPICWSCSGLAPRGDPLCRACRLALHRLAAEPVFLSGVRVWAPVAYSGPARDLVRALKFRGAIALADTMAAQMVANAPPYLLAAPDGAAPARCVLVPVPLHPRRLRSRGYNQAAAIAEAVARRARLEVAACLVRSGPSVAQVGRNRAERRSGPAGAIAVRASAQTPPGTDSPLVPGRVILVDDVVTTGATLGACRDALVANGVREVAALAFARTIGR